MARYGGARPYGDRDKKVEQACTQSAAPSSTNAVVEEVASGDTRSFGFNQSINHLFAHITSSNEAV